MYGALPIARAPPLVLSLAASLCSGEERVTLTYHSCGKRLIPTYWVQSAALTPALFLKHSQRKAVALCPVCQCCWKWRKGAWHWGYLRRGATVFLGFLQSELVDKEIDPEKAGDLFYAMLVEEVCTLQAWFEWLASHSQCLLVDASIFSLLLYSWLCPSCGLISPEDTSSNSLYCSWCVGPCVLWVVVVGKVSFPEHTQKLCGY